MDILSANGFWFSLLMLSASPDIHFGRARLHRIDFSEDETLIEQTSPGSAAPPHMSRAVRAYERGGQYGPSADWQKKRGHPLAKHPQPCRPCGFSLRKCSYFGVYYCTDSFMVHLYIDLWLNQSRLAGNVGYFRAPPSPSSDWLPGYESSRWMLHRESIPTQTTHCFH